MLAALLALAVLFPASAHPTKKEKGPRLLNASLEVDPPLDMREPRPFGYKIEALAKAALEKGAASHVSVYFRDFEDGPLFGIADDEKFSPASLLKVPLMIALLKRAQKEPGLLKKKVPYAKTTLVNPSISAATQLTEGKSYTIDELMGAMITHSDNGAAVLIRAQIGPDAMDEVYRDLGIQIPSVRGPGDSMSVREYATFFRILFNAGYLNAAMSRKALQYLTRSEFNGGLEAGVPPATPVAHKFGERVQDGVLQLHDCGIVYHPRDPYLLCVMTRGKDVGALSGVISDISRAVYTEMAAERY
jgi:beta-lactamase class A